MPSRWRSGRSRFATPIRKSTTDCVFQCLFTLASIQTAQEHYGDAEPLFKRALSIQEKELTGSHVNTLMTLDRLAFVLRSQGKYHEAEPLYRRAIAIHERKNPDENLELADTIDQYVILLRKLNRKDDAEKWEARALSNSRHGRHQSGPSEDRPVVAKTQKASSSDHRGHSPGSIP